jgi:hypothetical protein
MIPPESSPLSNFRGALKKVSEDKELQEKLRPITTADGIVAVASQLEFHFSAPDLIRHFAEILLHADDAQAVILFDALGWHFGSLLWALKLTA